ncbi:MAG: cytochrome c biogenesis protein CcsA, partial [Actinomycetota bacterium]
MVGRGLIIVAAGFALFSAVLSLREEDPALASSARRAAVASFLAVLLALALLWVALFRRDFSIAYVAQQTTTRTSLLYTFAGLWGGMAGSLLLWSAMLAGYGAAVAKRARGRAGGIVLATVQVTTAFFILLTGLAANPFAASEVVPADGRGLNPLLHSWGMAAHPLLLYLGWTGTTVVFGWALAGVITRTPWVTRARRWTLFSWLTLGSSLVVGGAWAYTELGWGGVWGWDPVENAPLLSFLALTALLHSQQVEERRGLLRTWNASLAALAFLLAILGTFLTRSGSLY